MPPLALQAVTILTLIKVVVSNYCEWDLCRTDQYCCGDNTCCDYVYSLWYFWVGVIFLILLVSACGGLFRLYYRSWKLNGNGQSFTSLPTEISDEKPLFQVTTRNDMKTHLSFSR